MAIKPRLVKVWNHWDEFGLINGLGHWSEDGKTLEYVRYPGETNKQLKRRLKLAREYMGNSTKQGMIDNISRDLGVSVSGVGLLPRYNSETKTTFNLSEKPYPGYSGIFVSVSTSGTFSIGDRLNNQQVRASGYSTATSGWIVWNQPDYDPSMLANGTLGSSGWFANQDADGSQALYDPTIKWGEYTQILEFIGDTVPNTDERIMVEYQVQTGTDDFGRPILNWRSDTSASDDENDLRFVGLKSEIPEDYSSYNTWVTDKVNIIGIADIKTGPLSGLYYKPDGRGTSELIRLKKDVFDEYEMTWGKFRLDEGRWDMLDNASIGNIPSFHDEPTPTGYVLMAGSKYDIDLDMVGIQIQSSGVRAQWWPKFQPGEFYIGNSGYYLYSDLQSGTYTFTHVGSGVMSGNLSALDRLDAPYEFGPITVITKGSADWNPYAMPMHDPSSPNSDIMYRTSWVDYGSGMLAASGVDFDSGQAFYYDYGYSGIYALYSGVTPPATIDYDVYWEPYKVEASGLYCIYSGGYGLSAIDLNPINDPFDKLYYISD